MRAGDPDPEATGSRPPVPPVPPTRELYGGR